MFKKIKSAIEWRLERAGHIRLKLYWNIKRFFDFSTKVNVNNISIIVVGRNDNYGGDFRKRLQTTLDWNISNLPESELIYIEWNKIKDRDSDTEWISERYNNSRCFIVSEEIHKKICKNPQIPMMEYFAKNMGIRRAKYNWILLINADVFLDPITVKRMNKLNINTIYGTHYINIDWDRMPINYNHINKKNIRKTSFSTNKNLSSVVGNLILTHKNNWLKAKGYDESLRDVRSGVDNDGLKQLLSLGLKTMVLGNHFHLDHPEASTTSGYNPTHGNINVLKNRKYPYKNADNWGLANYKELQIKERIWQIEEI
ncbi:MAG: hypothetical protein Q8880_10580 [Bacteroidota bacterium]|nr:hypothetical protein [Bacteroidota bacterium]